MAAFGWVWLRLAHLWHRPSSLLRRFTRSHVCLRAIPHPCGYFTHILVPFSCSYMRVHCCLRIPMHVCMIAITSCRRPPCIRVHLRVFTCTYVYLRVLYVHCRIFCVHLRVFYVHWRVFYVYLRGPYVYSTCIYVPCMCMYANFACIYVYFTSSPTFI